MTARPARILAAAGGITASASAGLAAALINAAIIRKPPSSEETSGGSDLVAATTAAARREGRAWMAATPHQRWTIAELHAAQPHADLWIVPGADHVMSYFTDPGAYRKRVEQFLRRLPQA